MFLLTIRALIFTILVPGTVAVWLPLNILSPAREIRHPSAWIIVAAGVALYLWCALQFLLNGHGTPNIWFAKHLGFLIGRSPERLVQSSIYAVSRNPMYLGVLIVLVGEAVLCGSLRLLEYACVVAVVFHLIVVFVEEPHLRHVNGEGYIRYCRQTPRWLGFRSRSDSARSMFQ